MKVLSVAILLLMSSCGFHLRTWDIGSNLESARVVESKRNFLTTPLRQVLSQSGVTEAEQGESQVVVELLEQRTRRRSVSVTGQGRAAEYETTLEVLYRVYDSGGVELIEPRWLRSERVFRVDRNNIVGNSEEQALLEQEMRNDLIQQILRSLDAVTRSTANAG